MDLDEAAAVTLFDKTRIPLLGKALDAYALRHKVISSNIANVTTEGYHSQSVAFEDQLAGAIKGEGVQGLTTDTRHFPVGTAMNDAARPQIDESTAEGSLNEDDRASGINNVDIDHEMSELAKNQLRFKFAVRMLSDTFRGIQKSIRGQS